MDRLQSMRVFCKVASAGSFTRAADELDMSGAVVSRLVADLEQHLRTRLLNRTTRSVQLTEEGRDYFLRCQHILEQIDEAESLAAGQTGHATGKLRMLVSFTEGLQLLAPHLIEFREKHPDVTLDIQLAERAVDILAEGFDIAIQPEPFIFSNSVIARNLTKAKLILCASPAYLKRHGTPATPEELALHACISLSPEELRAHWPLHSDKGETTVKPNNVLVSNNLEAVLGAVRTGMGIGLAFEGVIQREIALGNLVRVLPDYYSQEVEYFIVYPSRKYLPAKVRAMIEFLLKLFDEARLEASAIPYTG